MVFRFKGSGKNTSTGRSGTVEVRDKTGVKDRKDRTFGKLTDETVVTGTSE